MTLIEALERLMELWQLPWSEERYGEGQALLARVKEIAVRTRPCKAPPGSRLVLASQDFLQKLGARTEDGFRIVAVWGAPDGNDWYTPTFMVDYGDMLDPERIVEPAA